MTWRERIAEARRRGHFSYLDGRLAGDFRTCAVGEQHKMLPDVVILSLTVEQETAVDDELTRLGLDFPIAVMFDDFEQAETVLDAIEDRVLQLKREAK